ncbi:ABC transporter permease [Acetobacterium carbinolicum]|uniref:ABC transporter permease n=1 Tax=Acetobacterium carbinolicum TaxID=52690 RepID=UPI0039BF6865
MNTMQSALIRKDIRGITANKQLLVAMISVPIALTVVIPSIFIMLLHFMPNDLTDFDIMLRMLPTNIQSDNMNTAIISLLLNNIMPVFFIIIPIMAASIMAASSFVGEKEKRTLETLLYCPLSLKQIFRSKILSSFIMSELVSVLSFIIMTLVTQIEIFLTTGSLLLPNISWLVVLLLLSPAVSLISITLIVRGSAKAQTMEESQQRSALLVLPVIFLVAGQFVGIILINIWILLGLGVLLAAIAWILMNGSFQKISYESMLR